MEYFLHSVFILEQILVVLVCRSLLAPITEPPLVPSADQLATVPLECSSVAPPEALVCRIVLHTQVAS